MSDTKIVIYTAVFNQYDLLISPKYTAKNIDYVCFTDKANIATGVWEPRIVDEYEMSPKLMSGKIKTNPHILFPEYDYSIWIDGNIQITEDPRQLINKYLSKTPVAVPSHPKRDCIYQEGNACMDGNKADQEKIRKQLSQYQKEGFPQNYGLSETRVLIRDHNDSKVIDCMEIWWEEYRKGAERDQLSFEFAIWKSGLEYNQIDSNSNTNPIYLRHPHRLPNSKYTYIYDILLYTYIFGPKTIQSTVRSIIISLRILDNKSFSELIDKLNGKLAL